MRGATKHCEEGALKYGISIHAPHAGRDQLRHLQQQRVDISIHAPHAGRDTMSDKTTAAIAAISIHAPHAGRDELVLRAIDQPLAISIHAPHAGRDAALETVHFPVAISIHAPHAGRDPPWSYSDKGCNDFNPRAPCGARRRSPSCCWPPRHFNPRAPCGARLTTLPVLVR